MKEFFGIVKELVGAAKSKVAEAGATVKTALANGSLLGNIIVVIGLLMLVASVVFGLWAWLWWGLVGGIVMVVEAIKMDPVVAMDIAIGGVRFFLATPIGWGAFFVSAFVSFLVIGLGSEIGKK